LCNQVRDAYKRGFEEGTEADAGYNEAVKAAYKDGVEESRLRFEQALSPLVAIADAYDKDGLNHLLVSDRGNKKLLSIEDCMRARDLVRKK
jgi:hypothetical protein